MRIRLWTKPEINCVKFNCDDALFDALPKVGVEWIARNNEGMLIEAGARTFPGITEKQCAEAIGIREALGWIKQEEGTKTNGEQSVSYIVESDSQLVTMQKICYLPSE